MIYMIYDMILTAIVLSAGGSGRYICTEVERNTGHTQKNGAVLIVFTI